MPSRIRTVVVDDQPAARRGVRRLLSGDDQIEIIGEAGSGVEAAELIRRERPALAFLDVQMRGCDGFQVLGRVGVGNAPVVVFVTAYDEQALRAFEASAVDYLLKPYDDVRFGAALQRAKDAVRRRQGGVADARLTRLLEYLRSASKPAPHRGRILIKAAAGMVSLKAEDIDWIEAEGDYMKFHARGKTHLMRETMARLETRLDPGRFVRIHRSAIVNIDRLKKLSPALAGDYAVLLADGTKLKLSRGYHDRIAAFLKRGL